MRIGIDIGGSHIGIGLVDNKNNIIIKKEHNWTSEEKNNFLKSIQIYIKKIIKEIKEEKPDIIIEKIGIGFPSSDIVNGIATKNGETINLPEILKKEFNIPTYLKNDVKCSGICEKTLGNLKNYDNCIFLTLGTGIGGAYFYKNKLVSPNKYQGFEIGHMVIDINGRKCRCGQNGCFEEYASMRAFRREVEELFNIDKITSFKMFEIIESGQKREQVNEIIERYTDFLAIGIANLIKIFEPDAICIGGSFSYYEKIFMPKLENKIQNYLLNPRPKILIAKYENDAGIIGASLLESN